MGKDTHFTGQPIFEQLLSFLNKSKIHSASKAMGADKYVKRFDSYSHVVVMLFAVTEGFHSLRETVLGLLSHANKLRHLGLTYIVRRSELLYKQLKQNFPLKYFLGDNENAITIQIWCAMLANLLLTILRSKIKKKWAFSNMMSVIRYHLMSYINVYSFFENPEKTWTAVIKADHEREEQMKNDPQLTLFRA